MVLPATQLLYVEEFIRYLDSIVEVPTLHFAVGRDGTHVSWRQIHKLSVNLQLGDHDDRFEEVVLTLQVLLGLDSAQFTVASTDVGHILEVERMLLVVLQVPRDEQTILVYACAHRLRHFLECSTHLEFFRHPNRFGLMAILEVIVPADEFQLQSLRANCIDADLDAASAILELSGDVDLPVEGVRAWRAGVVDPTVDHVVLLDCTHLVPAQGHLLGV